MNLVKTKTFWVGVAALIAALIDSAFGSNDSIERINFGEAFKALIADPKFFLGLASITGRAAIGKLIEALVRKDNPPTA